MPPPDVVRQLADQIPPSWKPALARVVDSPGFASLAQFVAAERAKCAVFPPEQHVFRALELTPPDAVRVVLLGQDPYHDHGQAHGLCFSVATGTALPPSLKNIFKELESDLGIKTASGGDLSAWAKRGVLLLNAVLTVRAHEPQSHQKQGWETVTDAIFTHVVQSNRPVVFLLWGAPAQKKNKLIPQPPHVVLSNAHPSPLSAHKGFLGSRPFSKANEALERSGQPPIDWHLD